MIIWRKGQVAVTLLTFGLLAVAGSTQAASTQDTTSMDAKFSATAMNLSKAYKIIKNAKFVDLTHTFSPATPVWHGFGHEIVARAANPKTGGLKSYTIPTSEFRAQIFTHVGQYGTHVDPPAHFDPNGKTADQINVRQMILPLVVINEVPLLNSNPEHALTVQDIKNFEAKHGRIPAGSFVALRTDFSKNWTKNPSAFDDEKFPAWSLASIKFLYQKRHVTATGHETADTDDTPKLQSEVWLLKHDHWQIELMNNLDKVPATGSLVVVTWPKPLNGLGFPARVFAIVPNGR